MQVDALTTTATCRPCTQLLLLKQLLLQSQYGAALQDSLQAVIIKAGLLLLLRSTFLSCTRLSRPRPVLARLLLRVCWAAPLAAWAARSRSSSGSRYLEPVPLP
jgi:hypothetical protein